MKSPRFVLREEDIRKVFAASRLSHTWRTKVRDKMRNHVLPDPIEHLDFHLNLSANCDQIAQLVCSGHYLPAPAHRILMEKSKGLCRQIVIPHVRDALVLQCLSDALYADIRGKAPSTRSFFEPEDHTFSNVRKSILGIPRYGPFRAWLNFQTALFKFTDDKEYIVRTDIANYYDYISYTHLRNIVASAIDVRESILDMLIFILSGLLWQPDYAPRVEVGLPQMDIDAVRILAHCFLYELDAFLEKDRIDFVRYMDDIDIGVDSVNDARRILRDMDLILHTRQVRLNTGKTEIMRSRDAERHFRVRENFILDSVVRHIDRRLANRQSIHRERKHIRRALRKYYKHKKFDDGNGEKILARLLTLSRKMDAKVDGRILDDILRRRPGARDAALGVIEWQPLDPIVTTRMSTFLTSAIIVDEWTYIEAANAIVHSEVRTKRPTINGIRTIVYHLEAKSFFGVYAAIWLMSKYEEAERIYAHLLTTQNVWRSDVWLGRLVGGLSPVFHGTVEESRFRNLVRSARNSGAEEVSDFHGMLRTDTKAVGGVRKFVLAPNPSKRLGITHAKFLMLLSILANDAISDRQKAQYLNAHRGAWKDAFYRWRARSMARSPNLKALIRP